MTFEPIQTDERVEGGGTKEPDFDDQMMFGCTQFVIQSACVYGLAAWPHFVWPSVFEIRTLAIDMAAGFVPAFVQAIVGGRRMGLPSAVGSLCGALAFGIFLYLRLQQVHAPSGIRGAPIPEWPKEWVWMAPTATVLIFAVGLFLVVPREQWSFEGNAGPPKIAENDSDN